MENLHKTEQELEIDFTHPLGEQDPMIKLNDHARKKRKHANDIHDHFRLTKRYKSSVQYKDHPAGTVLNEPCLGMIPFNSHQRRDYLPLKTLEISQTKCCILYKKSSSDFTKDLAKMIMLGLSVPFYLLKLIKGT
ncbi:hypothetical protein Tco_0084700 [Tanacetum coccineum]